MHRRLLIDQCAVGTNQVLKFVVIGCVDHEITEFAPKPLGYCALNQSGKPGAFVKNFHGIIGRVINDVHLRTVKDDGHDFLREDLSITYLGPEGENARSATQLMP